MIGEWMLYGCVVSASAAGIAWTADTWRRTRRRPTRWIWFGAAMATVLVPLGASLRPEGVPKAAPAMVAPYVLETGAAVDTRDRAIDANALLGIAWLGTSLLMSVALVAGLVQLSRARRRGRRVALAGS
ncbi:MAG: hypothetical protein ACT4P7_17720, partial [Gemmatimonadaceae bacterium]